MKLKILTFIVGLTGIFVETILLREILVLSESNELVISLAIVSWLLVQSFGAYFTEKLLNKILLKKLTFYYFLGFVLYSFLSIFLVRESKFFLGYTVGQPLGIIEVFFVSIVVLLPLGIFHNGLFIILSEEFAEREEKVFAINKVYLYELLGTVFGGIVLPFWLLQNFDVFRIIFLSNILFATIFLIYNVRKLLTFVVFFINILGIFFSDRINFYSMEKFYKQKVLEIKNSVYNNIVVTKYHDQNTFYLGGEPYIITPQENNLFNEELKIYGLSLVEKKDIVVTLFGNFLGKKGFLENFNITEVKKINFLEKDFELINLYNKYVEKYDSDDKINFIYSDILTWLKKKEEKSDLFYINIGYPKNLYLNRYFTIDFFKLLKEVLSKDGVVIIIFPGNINYMSEELKLVNKNLNTTLSMVWKNIFILPSETENIFFATDKEVNLFDVIKKNSYKQKTNLVTKEYLNYKLNKNKVEWFNKQMEEVATSVNTNYNLLGMFYGLRYWNLLHSPVVNRIYVFISKIKLKDFYYFFFVFVIFLYLFKYKKDFQKENFVFDYIIFTSGVAGFVGMLLLIFFVQVVRGYVYSHISFFSAIFFLGSVLGTILAQKIKVIKTIFLSEIVIMTLFIFMLFISLREENLFILYFLSFVLGLTTSFEFNFLAKKFSEEGKIAIKKISSRMNVYDLLGSTFGGLFLVSFLLPVKGVYEIINFVLMIKVVGIVLLLLRI